MSKAFGNSNDVMTLSMEDLGRVSGGTGVGKTNSSNGAGQKIDIIEAASDPWGNTIKSAAPFEMGNAHGHDSDKPY